VDLGLQGSAAVVTGGSKGMGRAIAAAFADDGARVAVLARGQAAIDDTVAELRGRGCPDAVGLSVDLTDPSAIEGAFATIGERWGEINSLINTIGPGDGYFETLDDGGWDATMQLGLMAMVRCTRAALPLLRAAEWARIVNFAAHLHLSADPRFIHVLRHLLDYAHRCLLNAPEMQGARTVRPGAFPRRRRGRRTHPGSVSPR